MKKYSTYLLTLILCATSLLSGCKQSVQETTIIESSVPDMDLSVHDEPESVQVDRSEFYHSENLIITLNSIESDSFDTYAILEIQNISDRDLTIACELASINDYIIDAYLTEDIAAGDTITTGLTFANADINFFDIEKICKIDFQFSVYPTDDSYESIEDSGWQTVLNETADDVQTDTRGTLLYDQNNIRLITKGVAYDSEGLPVIIMMVINDSDQDIFLDSQVGESAADQYETAFSTDVPAHKKALKSLYFYDENGDVPDQINDIPVSFSILDGNTWHEITTTDQLLFKYNIDELSEEE